MKIIKYTYICDVCKTVMDEREVRNEGTTSDTIKKQSVSVVFTTEQTEGYPCKPHFESEALHICDKCLDRMLSGDQLFAKGAQGNNTYYFNSDIKAGSK